MIGQAVNNTDKPPASRQRPGCIRPGPLSGPTWWPRQDPEQARLTAGLDRSISELVAEVMHHRDFRGPGVGLARGSVPCVPHGDGREPADLFAGRIQRRACNDLFSNDDLPRRIYRILTEGPAVQRAPWRFPFLPGNYSIDHSDAALLGRMAKIAAAVHAPFIAQADPCLVGCSTLSGTPDPAAWRTFPDGSLLAAWDSLRRLPEAAYLGLVMHRASCCACRSAATRMRPRPSDFRGDGGRGRIHEHYADAEALHLPAHTSWRAPCSAPLQLGHAHAGAVKDVDNLPLHVHSEQGSSTVKPMRRGAAHRKGGRRHHGCGHHATGRAQGYGHGAARAASSRWQSRPRRSPGDGMPGKGLSGFRAAVQLPGCSIIRSSYEGHHAGHAHAVSGRLCL
ncbi:MAG: type VI secretion system contractile sheath large subunit [Desulfobacterales bacterium]|nr:type VI secretion system contractile sheath large subunit [Desulfobacterales bacterium]